MTRPTTDDTRPDTIRDAFEAILALLQMLIARKFSGLYTPAVRLGVEVGEQLDITHPHSGKSLLALRDLIQRAAEEHNRRALPLPPFALTDSPPVDRESLGRLVREVWIEWAREQAAPKPSWLVPWEDLAEPDREVDRRIGERIAQTVLAAPAATAADTWLPARIAEALERCERATPGPWIAVFEDEGDIRIQVESGIADHATAEDYAFIAAARTDLPSALRALATAQGEIERLNTEADTLSDDLATARHAESRWQERCLHAHDSANRMYQAARGVCAADADALRFETQRQIAALRAAIDPAEEAAALAEVQRRDGLAAEIERLTASELDVIRTAGELAVKHEAEIAELRADKAALAAKIETMIGVTPRTPATVLRAMLASATEAAIEAEKRYYLAPRGSDAERAADREVADLSERINSIRGCLSHALTGASPLMPSEWQEDYAARLAGTTPVDAPPRST